MEGEKEGFYLSHQARNGKHTSVLCCRIDTAVTKKNKTDGSKTKKEAIMFQVYRPNTGLQFRTESLAELEKKYKKVQSDEAEHHWTQQFDASVNTCSHAYWRGNCRNVTMGHECEVSKYMTNLVYKSLLILLTFQGGTSTSRVHRSLRFRSRCVGTC